MHRDYPALYEALKNFINLESDLQEIAVKQGSEIGYIVKSHTDLCTYMIKASAIPLNATFVREYLCAGAYQRVLYNRAPWIELVTDVSSTYLGEPTLGCCAEFLKDFLPILGISSNAHLKDIKAFSKVLAMCFWLGESDKYADNLGITQHV